MLEWVRQRNVVAGTTQTLELPASLSHASRDGKVYVAGLADGRLCVMLKTHIGYKDNFDGALRCSGPLQANEIVPAGGRPYVTIPGHGIFEELYIRSQISDSELEIYFDLN